MGKLFKGISNASASMEANYARPGHYLVMLLDAKQGETRKGESFVAIRKKCVAVLGGEGDNPHRVGEEFTDMLMAKQDTFLPNFKKFVMVATGEEDEDSITEEVAEEVTGDDQPLSGLIMEVENVERIGQKTGKPYTRKAYKRVLSREEIEEQFDDGELEKALNKIELETMIDAYQALDGPESEDDS